MTKYESPTGGVVRFYGPHDTRDFREVLESQGWTRVPESRRSRVRHWLTDVEYSRLDLIALFVIWLVVRAVLS